MLRLVARLLTVAITFFVVSSSGAFAAEHQVLGEAPVLSWFGDHNHDSDDPGHASHNADLWLHDRVRIVLDGASRVRLSSNALVTPDRFRVDRNNAARR